jgi:hypothetical protein
MTELRNVTISSPVNPLGHVQVDVEDYMDKLYDAYFLQEQSAFTLASPTTASGATAGTFVYTFTATAGHGIVAGNEIALIDTAGDVFFYATVPAGGVAGNVITLDRPIDHVFPTATTLGKIVSSNLAVDGSVTPQIFEIQGGATSAHINRIIITMLCDSQPYGNLFANIAALTNGLVIRAYDGFKYTVFNFKDNADIFNNCYDVTYGAGTVGPSGAYSVTARITFNAKDKHGTTIELEAGDAVQAIVQDDLTTGGPDIQSIQIVAQGHFHEHTP